MLKVMGWELGMHGLRLVLPGKCSIRNSSVDWGFEVRVPLASLM